MTINKILAVALVASGLIRFAKETKEIKKDVDYIAKHHKKRDRNRE